jgi:hypothetical protein
MEGMISSVESGNRSGTAPGMEHNSLVFGLRPSPLSQSPENWSEGLITSHQMQVPPHSEGAEIRVADT